MIILLMHFMAWNDKINSKGGIDFYSKGVQRWKERNKVKFQMNHRANILTFYGQIKKQNQFEERNFDNESF